MSTPQPPPEPASRPPVGVMIVDDDPLVRAGLAMMLGGAPDLRVVAEAGDGTRCCAWSTGTPPTWS